MSAPSLSYADQLEETQRLKKLGDEICADISEVLEQRGEIKLRYAILQTIDDGDPDTKAPWAIDHCFPDVANASRLDFVDAIINKLRAG